MGKLMNMKEYVRRLSTPPSTTMGQRPLLVKIEANIPNRTPPTTSPTATRIALREARDFLSGPNLMDKYSMRKIRRGNAHISRTFVLAFVKIEDIFKIVLITG